MANNGCINIGCVNINRKCMQLAVFHLHKHVTTELLYECFSLAGEVYDAHIIPDRSNPQWNYGFVTMRRAVAIDCVYHKRIEILGQRVFVTFAEGEPSERSKRIETYKKRRAKRPSSRSREDGV